VTTFYNYIPHLSVLATRDSDSEYVKRTVSAVADGAACIGGKIYYAVPHRITFFLNLEVTFVLESICSWLIDQRPDVIPVVAVPCVCFGTPQSV
jgi:hypothetical protein